MAQKPMNAPKGGKAISDELIGIFFEDISSSADGGLFAELLHVVPQTTTVKAQKKETLTVAPYSFVMLEYQL